ncbi:hypothetical protein ABYF34_06265 [Buchananella felis]|uniref:hypothetical protein n=1 Tax=Buchananella felis TaxID=3231492 RepID=UPI003527420C
MTRATTGLLAFALIVLGTVLLNVRKVGAVAASSTLYSLTIIAAGMVAAFGIKWYVNALDRAKAEILASARPYQAPLKVAGALVVVGALLIVAGAALPAGRGFTALGILADVLFVAAMGCAVTAGTLLRVGLAKKRQDAALSAGA